MDSSRLFCCWCNTYDRAASWLITISVGTCHAYGKRATSAYPQSRAVVDDFGALVCVEAWK